VFDPFLSGKNSLCDTESGWTLNRLQVALDPGSGVALRFKNVSYAGERITNY
jgi:hypothetical protein